MARSPSTLRKCSYLASLLFFFPPILSLVFFIFLAAHKKITAKAILAFKLNWTVNLPAKACTVWSGNLKARKKINPATGLGLFYFVYRPRCSLWCWGESSRSASRGNKKKRKYKKQKNKLSHPFEGGGFKKISLLLWCPLGMNYTSTQGWIYAKHYSPPCTTLHFFYKFEYTARIFSRIFNFHPSSLRRPSLGSLVHTFGGILFSFLISSYVYT